MVPNQFVVELGPSDYERLSVYADTLGTELASLVREHAEEQHYSFHGPVTVELVHEDDLSTGQFRVRSAAVAGAVPADPGRVHDNRAAPWLEIGATTYALTGPTTRIGRGNDTDLRIDDPGISRNHAEIRQQGGDVMILDAGSTNGVLVDGHRVQQARLRDGARIQLGNTTVVFHAGPQR